MFRSGFIRTLPFAAFLRDDRAALSIEAAIMLPLLAVLYVTGFGYFDAYRREAVLTKATYTMGDLLSREEGTITPFDLEGLQDVFEFLTFSEGDTWLRTTEVRRTGDSVAVTWSYATDGNQVMTTARLQGYLNQIPSLADGERVVLTESFTDFEPVFNIGLTDRTFTRFITTRQRYAPRLDLDSTVMPSDVTNVRFDDTENGSGNGNNGWGNGAQPAPGNSGPNNNAANSTATVPPGQI
ncbi:MAG: hypothetical protein WBA67_13035 [Jannaschia sp.]